MAGSRWSGFTAGSGIQQSLRYNRHETRKENRGSPASDSRLMSNRTRSGESSVRTSQVRQTDTHTGPLSASRTRFPCGLACSVVITHAILLWRDSPHFSAHVADSGWLFCGGFFAAIAPHLTTSPMETTPALARSHDNR